MRQTPITQADRELARRLKDMRAPLRNRTYDGLRDKNKRHVEQRKAEQRLKAANIEFKDRDTQEAGLDGFLGDKNGDKANTK